MAQENCTNEHFYEKCGTVNEYYIESTRLKKDKENYLDGKYTLEAGLLLVKMMLIHMMVFYQNGGVSKKDWKFLWKSKFYPKRCNYDYEMHEE